MNLIITLNKNKTMEQFDTVTYQEKISEDKLTLVKYNASWCGPCRSLSPIIEGIIKNYPDINAGEVDIDTHSNLAIRDGVRGVPTIIFYKNGVALDRMVGLHPSHVYTQKIESLK